MRAGQRCQVKLSRPHIEVSQSPSPGILRMRISPWLWFSTVSTGAEPSSQEEERRRAAIRRDRPSWGWKTREGFSGGAGLVRAGLVASGGGFWAPGFSPGRAVEASGCVFHRLGWFRGDAPGQPAWSSTVRGWWWFWEHPAWFSGHPALSSTGWGWWSDQSAGFRGLAEFARFPAIHGGRGALSLLKSFFPYIYRKLNVCITSN